jgi:hypothetical protein
METNAKFDMLWRGESWRNVSKISDKKLRELEYKLLDERIEHFNSIIESENNDIWYRDNIGGYVVAIETRKCKKEECDLPKSKSVKNCNGRNDAL